MNAPVDPRLPDGGGYQMCGLYDLDRALFGRGQSAHSARIDSSASGNRLMTGSTSTGQARLAHGVNFSGGMNIGRTRTNTCFVVDSPQALRFCDNRPPFQPNLSFVGVVPLPWYGIFTAFTYRDYPGFGITGKPAIHGRADRAVARPAVFERRQWNGQRRADRARHDVRPEATAVRFPAVEALRLRRVAHVDKPGRFEPAQFEHGDRRRTTRSARTGSGRRSFRRAAGRRSGCSWTSSWIHHRGHRAHGEENFVSSLRPL